MHSGGCSTQRSCRQADPRARTAPLARGCPLASRSHNLCGGLCSRQQDKRAVYLDRFLLLHQRVHRNPKFCRPAFGGLVADGRQFVEVRTAAPASSLAHSAGVRGGLTDECASDWRGCAWRVPVAVAVPHSHLHDGIRLMLALARAQCSQMCATVLYI